MLCPGQHRKPFDCMFVIIKVENDGGSSYTTGWGVSKLYSLMYPSITFLFWKAILRIIFADDSVSTAKTKSMYLLWKCISMHAMQWAHNVIQTFLWFHPGWHPVAPFSAIIYHDVFFDQDAWMNGWVNNHEARDLRRHRAHYDVTLMHFCYRVVFTLSISDQVWLIMDIVGWEHWLHQLLLCSAMPRISMFHAFVTFQTIN